MNYLLDKMNKNHLSFLSFLIENNNMFDLNFISKIKFNKKSITIYINCYKHNVFNDLFNNEKLFEIIKDYMVIYFDLNENTINGKFKKLNIIEKS